MQVAAGHSELRLHHLRHAHGTALAEINAHPKTIQQRLGHASASFTMNTYVHGSDTLDAEAANLIGMRFGRRSVEKLAGEVATQVAETSDEHA